MQTFIGEYQNGNFTMSSDAIALKAQLVSILNTPIGTRFYYPSFGSNLSQLRFSVLNYYTINIITQAIKDAVELINGVRLLSLVYTIKNNSLLFTVNLDKLSTKYSINISVSDGVAS